MGGVFGSNRLGRAAAVSSVSPCQARVQAANLRRGTRQEQRQRSMMVRIGTRVTRAGLPPSTQGAPFLPGPTFAGPYHAAGDPASAPLTYGRFHNPTWTYFEQALSELEGGPAVTFASGMAAVAAIFGVVLRPGDVVV